MTAHQKEKLKWTTNVLYGQSTEYHFLTLPALSTHGGLWLLNTSPDYFQKSVKPRPQKKTANVNDHLETNFSTVLTLTHRKHLLPSPNAWFSFKKWLFPPVVLYIKPSGRFAAPKHGWLGQPARLMRLEWFPFDLRLPLSCQFTLLPLTLPMTPCCHLHFTSPFLCNHILHSHHCHNSSKIKKIARPKPLKQVLLHKWILAYCKGFLTDF